jgi:hypothetical protein
MVAMKNLRTLFMAAALLNVFAAGEQCLADDAQVVGRDGSVFMQEDDGSNNKTGLPPVVEGKSAESQPSGPAEAPGQGAEIVGHDGNVFMEETHPMRRAASPPVQRKPVRILTHNYSNVGVATDPNGNIIPQINRTGQSVQPLGSTMSSTTEMPSMPVPSAVPGQLINVPGYAQPMMPYGVGIVPVGPTAAFRVGGMNLGIGPAMQVAPIVAPLGPGGPVLLPSPGLFGSPFYQRSYSGTSSTTIIAPPGGIPINNSGQ